MQILLVEDHPLTARSISLSLPKHSVTHAQNCRGALAALARQTFDVVVVDLSLPDGSGLDLCAELSDQVRQPGVIVLSGCRNTLTKVQALDAGADDYIVKPCAPPELIARVHAVARRRTAQRAQRESAPLIVGQYQFSPSERTLTSPTSTTQLTPHEATILETLITHQNQILTLNTLMATGQFCQTQSNSLQVHIKNLRQKLHLHSKTIETVYGQGYRLNTRYANQFTHT